MNERMSHDVRIYEREGMSEKVFDIYSRLINRPYHYDRR
jgi:hypothetical protein